MIKILIVEDEEAISDLIRMNLVKAGYRCVCAFDGNEAADQISQERFDLILLDIMLPGMNGYELLPYIKSLDIPVIFLTAMGTLDQRVHGLRAGADDYMAKPFSVEILLERIAAVIRRSAGEKDRQMFCYRGLTVDLGKMQVYKEQKPVKLSATEYRILELLIHNRNQVMTREMLLRQIWDIDENYVDENTLNVYIRRLRQKLEKDPKNPEYIITVFGIGYTFGDE